MNRKSWSNLFIFLAVVDLVMAILPHNPYRIVAWIALPGFIVIGAKARRRMI